jgi:hypothetical protein
VRKGFSDAQNTIAKGEAAYITKQDDLVQLVPKTTTPLQRILEKMTAFTRRCMADSAIQYFLAPASQQLAHEA